ncbi:MAG: glycosyltransferase family 9 protein [Nitrospinae bacterium]|nr:glycosyltransferase family 9 protein [Nitrospinota bacterium]
MYRNKPLLPDNPRILVVRTDRIGDVALSLPVFVSLRKAYPTAFIAALTRTYTRDLLVGRDDVDLVIDFPADSPHVPKQWYASLKEAIASQKFDAAILLFSNYSVARLIKAAGIPVRIGPASKVAVWFTLTHAIRQRRAKGTRHEADHNLDLLTPLGVAPVRDGRIPLPDAARRTFGDGSDRGVVGLHPGHGGSSQNWPKASYVALARRLADDGYRAVVTGSSAERALVERIVTDARVGADERVAARIEPFVNTGGIGDLLAVLAGLDVFVASSTGPLHLASAVGTPVVGIYSPVFVCLPERWGPIGPDDVALVPPYGPCRRCVGARCPHHDCMTSISVEQVCRAALSRLADRRAA